MARRLTGQRWTQIGDLGLAFVLSALIGPEREVRQKSAGPRTHTAVGVAAALIMLVSKYGFTNVLIESRVVVDPSRVAAQLVSGIGFPYIEHSLPKSLWAPSVLRISYSDIL